MPKSHLCKSRFEEMGGTFAKEVGTGLPNKKISCRTSMNVGNVPGAIKELAIERQRWAVRLPSYGGAGTHKLPKGN